MYKMAKTQYTIQTIMCVRQLMDFAILGTTKSPEFSDLREWVGLYRDKRLVRYAGTKLFRAL